MCFADVHGCGGISGGGGANDGKSTLVIAFYENDACKTKYTARSAAIHGLQVFDHILLLWVSQQEAWRYQDQVDEVRQLAGSTGLPVSFVDMQPFLVRLGRSGWEVQQVVKLMSSFIATTEFLVVFDAKNTIIEDLPPHTFVDANGRAILNANCKLYAYNSEVHRNWAIDSARIFGAQWTTDEFISDSVSPFVFHRLTVRPYRACMRSHA